MPFFSVERTVPLPPEEAWRRLTEWPRHGEAVPFTRITVLTPEPTREGTGFVARTGVGPFGFDDPMEVTVWRPPADGGTGLCRLEKHGRVILGWAEIEVSPRPGGRTRVVWREDARIRFVPRIFDVLVARTARAIFGHTANRLLRRA
ncbi:SRPBCC family protein [Streptomyces sp. NPDC004014]